MNQNLSKAFKNLPEIEPSGRLEGNIIQYIQLAERKRLRNRLYFVQLGFIVSLMALVLSIMTFGQTILRSDFWSFLQLIFSDYKIIFSAWGDYMFSLIETFPAAETSIMLIPVFGLLISFYYYFNLGSKDHYKHI